MTETARIVTTNAAAAALGCSRSGVQRLAKAGRLPVAARGPRGVLMFHVEDIERLVEERAR